MRDPSDNVVPFPSPGVHARADLAGLRSALRDLRREIDERFPAKQLDEREQSFDWMQLFDEVRHRVGTAGVAERSDEVAGVEIAR